jgi:hypothetical protein
MDIIESTPAQPDVSQLQEQCDALRHLVVSLMVLLLVVSGTLNIYLMRQWRFAQTDLRNAKQVIASVNANAAAINDFVNKLGEYGRTHPEFGPILTKYGVKANTPSGPAGAAPTAPPRK